MNHLDIFAINLHTVIHNDKWKMSFEGGKKGIYMSSILQKHMWQQLQRPNVLGKFPQALDTWIWAVSLILHGWFSQTQLVSWVGWGASVNCHLQVSPQTILFYRFLGFGWVIHDIQRLVHDSCNYFIYLAILFS